MTIEEDCALMQANIALEERKVQKLRHDLIARYRQLANETFANHQAIVKDLEGKLVRKDKIINGLKNTLRSIKAKSELNEKQRTQSTVGPIPHQMEAGIDELREANDKLVKDIKLLKKKIKEKNRRIKEYRTIVTDRVEAGYEDGDAEEMLDGFVEVEGCDTDRDVKMAGMDDGEAAGCDKDEVKDEEADSVKDCVKAKVSVKVKAVDLIDESDTDPSDSSFEINEELLETEMEARKDDQICAAKEAAKKTKKKKKKKAKKTKKKSKRKSRASSKSASPKSEKEELKRKAKTAVVVDDDDL